jgi:pilus assembly protein Flp/PilA
MFKFLRKIAGNSKGATAVEYGLIAALISVAAVSAMGTIGTKINSTFKKVNTTIV